MSIADTGHEFEARLAALRDAFDRGFAEPPLESPPPRREFLAIRAGDHRFALRLDELARVVPCGRIVPLPQLAPLSPVRGSEHVSAETRMRNP